MKTILPLLGAASLAWFTATAQTTLPKESGTAPIEESLRNEAEAAIGKAVKFLKAKQKADGSWSNQEYIALTGLPVWALAEHKALDEATRGKAVEFITKHAKPNGAIFADITDGRKGGGLPNYNTAISMVALHKSGAPGVTPLILKARSFVASGQHLGGDIYDGGFGYDSTTKRAYTDLSNTVIALEALALTKSLEDQRPAGEKKAEINNAAAEKYITSIQNRPESNPAPHVSEDPKDRNGFFYQPDKSMAGNRTNATGVVQFRSYGSMTYAGLLSFIYVDVSKQDPRVLSAYDWAVKNWTLNENPGMGDEGRYYFYNVLSKGMDTMGNDLLPRADGTTFNWRREVVKKLISLQKTDADGLGYWVNEENRWFEGDPVLVTSYALIALSHALP